MNGTDQGCILNTICEFIVDCEHKTAPIQEEGYPSIRTPNIGRGRLILEGVNRVSEETYTLWTQRAIPREGDLILAREAPVGNVAIIPKNLQVCLGQRTVLIRPDRSKVDPNYLVYLLLGDGVQGKIQSLTGGATVAHLNMGEIHKMELPTFPPLPTQQKIAAILSAYDDLIENNTRRIKILEEMAQAIYCEWFVNFRFPGHEGVRMVESELGLVPEGWEVLPFSQALTLQRGFDLTSADRQEGSVPIYGSIGLSGYHNIAKVKAPGIVTGRSGTLGLVHYVERDFWPHNTALWVKEFKKVTPLFTLFLLRAMDLKQYNGGVAVPTLDRNVVHRVTVIIPERKLIENFEEIVKPLFPLISNLEQKNANLRRTRDLLLPKLISGEIDVSALDILMEADV